LYEVTVDTTGTYLRPQKSDGDFDSNTGFLIGKFVFTPKTVTTITTKAEENVER
jgi:hypothetical protein